MFDLPCSAESVQNLAFLAEQFNQPECMERGGSKMSRHQLGKILQP